ncbi:prolyl oligopeptidase family serine peptidase [Mixta hanseatica]|nr:prolyl oligopeptidase family serine peptidase [Mixta hanseatica]
MKKINLIIQLITLVNVSLCYAKDDILFGSQYTLDRYRWMEVDQRRNNQWLELKTKQSQKMIDAFPWRKKLQKQLGALSNPEGSLSDIFYAGENRFYLRSTPAFPYSRLFIKRKGYNEKLLVDPPVGKGIHFFSPSYDGRYIAYGLSDNGSEFASIKIIDTRSGKDLTDIIPQVRYPHIIWQSDNHSFFYRRMPSVKLNALPSDRLAGEKMFLHQVGSNTSLDTPVFDSFMVAKKGASKYDNVAIHASPDSDWLLSSVSAATSGYSSAIFKVRADALSGPKTPWVKVIDSKDNVSHFVFSGKWLYLARYNNYSGYLVTRLNLDKPSHPEEKNIEWSNGELTGFITSCEALYITYHDSGIRRFVRIPFSNIYHVQNITLPFNGEITALFSSFDQKEILFTLQGWTIPPAIFRYDPDINKIENTKLIAPQSYDYADYEAEEKWVISKNKVRVPLTIIHRRGMKLDGTAPTWLTAYGAYGVSTFPDFDPSRLIWLRGGGIIAIAHVRGGGELGPLWHEAGRASSKENSITDFINCAEYLIAQGYTNPSRLAISGGSAGGIVIGMALAQRPGLFAAVAIDAGILNTTRLDQIPIGAMNFKEFGSPSTEQGMRNLQKIDAYHNLKDGIRYPAALLTVGLNDARVSPWQTAKFAARLEEIAAREKNSNPVLVFAERDAGHSPATYDQADKKFLDILTFFIWRTGLAKE